MKRAEGEFSLFRKGFPPNRCFRVMRATFISPAILVTALLAGCAAPAPSAKAPAASLDPSVNSRAIAKGMDGEEVIRRIGKPAEVRPLKPGDGHAEVWVYRRDAGTRTIQTATSTRQIEVPNFITGGTQLVNEPVYSTEQIKYEESISLLMYDGKLVEWKKSVAGRRAFN